MLAALALQVTPFSARVRVKTLTHDVPQGPKQLPLRVSLNGFKGLCRGCNVLGYTEWRIKGE